MDASLARQRTARTVVCHSLRAPSVALALSSPNDSEPAPPTADGREAFSAADTTHDISRAVSTIPNPNPDPNPKRNPDGGWAREAFTAAERSKIIAHRRRNADAARREEAARKAALELMLDEQKVRQTRAR